MSLRIIWWFLTQERKKTERSIFPLLCVFVLKKIALSTSWEMLKWYLKRFFALLKWGFSKLFSFTNSVATKLRKLFSLEYFINYKSWKIFKLYMWVCLKTPTHWATPPSQKNPKSMVLASFIKNDNFWDILGKGAGAWICGYGCGPIGGSGQIYPHVKFEHNDIFHD